jgi:hypothetical protein
VISAPVLINCDEREQAARVREARKGALREAIAIADERGAALIRYGSRASAAECAWVSAEIRKLLNESEDP